MRALRDALDIETAMLLKAYSSMIVMINRIKRMPSTIAVMLGRIIRLQMYTDNRSIALIVVISG